MELLQYFKIVRRWWWLILLPTLVVSAYALATYHAPLGGYALSLRYTAGQPATLVESPNYDPNYYRWLTSEYIVNALKDWTRTGNFVAAVNAKLAASVPTMPPASLSGADNARSILVVYLSTSLNDPQVATEQLRRTAEAVTAVLQEQNAEVFPQLGGQAAVVTPLDSPAPSAVPPSLREQLELPLKIGLGLAVGVALAFAAHYLDPFVREKDELERIGLHVMAELPKSGRSKQQQG